MPTEIHGHEVIAMIMASDIAYTRESLEHAIRQKFGSEARFHTCSASGMSPEELIAFLEERGKFVPRGDGFTIDPGRICQH